MKSRLLKKILNNTGYIVSNHGEYIAVGSALCHDLIKVDKKTHKISYALDTFRQGRAAINHPPLEFIWDKLHELVASGEIVDIIEGKDVIDNPLPVFSVRGGQLIESVTDNYGGWPNTDDNGVIMYDNTHFDTKEKALRQGISNNEANVQLCEDSIREAEAELYKRKQRLEKYQGYVAHLTELLNQLKHDGQ